MAVKVCMTQEMVERNDMGAQQGDCTHSNTPRAGNTQKFSFTCTKPPSRGEGTVTFVSPEAYTMNLKAWATMKGTGRSHGHASQRQVARNRLRHAQTIHRKTLNPFHGHRPRRTGPY